MVIIKFIVKSSTETCRSEVLLNWDPQLIEHLNPYRTLTSDKCQIIGLVISLSCGGFSNGIWVIEFNSIIVVVDAFRGRE